MPSVLSNAERKFLHDLEKGEIAKYSDVYRRILKHRILKKHKALTDDALLISKLLSKLQEL
jgi:hypothetical protein